MIKTFNEAVKYLERYIPTPDKKHPGELGLRRMEYFMGLLGNPQQHYPTIHVGGTSGKGSTATIIASILSTKYKVGLHTSPHLVKINERIKIIDKRKALSVKRKVDIVDDEFTALLNEIIPFVNKVEKSSYGKPSYFEIVTAMAFVYFKDQKVDIAVIEVGMGGRYDATNVVKPLVAVLTNVGLDHTEILGDTVEKIATDKVGIIKKGIQVISAVTQPSVVRIIVEKCKKEKARLSLLGRDFSYKINNIGEEGSVFDYKGKLKFKNLRLRLLGQHQIENATLAIRAIEVINNPITQLTNNPINSQIINEENIRNGLMRAFIPGRLEIINKKPLIILDGAHNSDKVKALIYSIRKIFPKKKVTSIIAIKNDKNAKEMLTQLLKISDRVIFTNFQLTADIGIINSFDPKELLTITQIIQQHRYISRHTKVVKKISVAGNVEKALDEAIKSAKPDDLILVTGSLYLVGEIKSALSVKDKA